MLLVSILRRALGDFLRYANRWNILVFDICDYNHFATYEIHEINESVSSCNQFSRLLLLGSLPTHHVFPINYYRRKAVRMSSQESMFLIRAVILGPRTSMDPVFLAPLHRLRDIESNTQLSEVLFSNVPTTRMPRKIHLG